MTAPSPNGAWAPVVIFAYNRRQRLAEMVNSLRGCTGFDESPIHIFVDGPRSPKDQPAVDAVRDYVRGLALPNVTFTLADANRGLRQSVFAGVSEILRTHDRVIVLEDDLVLSPIALRYFNEALATYEHVPRVWSIAGYVYDAEPLRDCPRVLALPFAHPWGWATWSRAWSNFALDNRPADADLHSRSFKTAFDMDGLYPFSAQIRNSIEGRVNSWYIHWYYTIFRNGGCSIFPPRRVLDNFGLSAGSHGGSLNPYDRLVKRPELLTTLPEMPAVDSIDYAALDRLRDSWEVRVQRFIARAGAAKRRIGAGR